MRVAFLNRQREAYYGGDLVQIDETIRHLSKVGVEAVYAPEGWTRGWLKGFDLVHVFHLNFGWSRYNFEAVWATDMPYVVTPVFYPSCDLGMSRSEMWEALDLASHVTPFSHFEFREMLNWVARQGFWEPPHTAIPNGTSERFNDYDAVPAEHRLPSVLHVAARPGDKNEELLSQVCREIGAQLISVTGYRHEALPGMYRNSSVFVNASDSERMSLTIGEALCSGCRVLATSGNRGNEWYGPGLVTIDPTNRIDLAKQIRRALDPETVWDYSPNRAARRLTWDRVALELQKVYEKVLSS